MSILILTLIYVNLTCINRWFINLYIVLPPIKFITVGVAKLLITHKNINLIHLSSTSVYGSQSLYVDENCKELLPQSPYAEIKIIVQAKNNLLLKKFDNLINDLLSLPNKEIFKTWTKNIEFHKETNNVLEKLLR